MFSSNTSQVSSDAVYVEDVFSNFLYTGNGSTQTITTGIDTGTKGGLIWVKMRDAAASHSLFDSTRASGSVLSTNTTDPASGGGSRLALTSTGFDLQSGGGGYNQSGSTYASWTFRKQPKFFDVVTYTGNGVAGRTVAHSLGSVPGVMIVKRTDTTGQWPVYHRSTSGTPQNDYLLLNQTAGAYINQDLIWNNTAPTSTVFTVGSNSAVNANGGTYVAYLFAHDAGGFGLTGTDNVISCGSFAGGTNVSVNLGWEPQWLLVKRATGSVQNWFLMDTMRGLTASQGDVALSPNLSNAEPTASGNFNINATGFVNAGLGSGTDTYIYIAIRRGPMKTPTTGTSVFAPTISTASTGTTLTTNFPIDLQMANLRDGNSTNTAFSTRLIGVNTTPTTVNNNYLVSSSTGAELTASFTRAWNNTGFQMPSYLGNSNDVFWSFQRAPGFFDVVCYTGTGSATTQAHNLGVAPEMMILKKRSASGSEWPVYVAPLGATQGLYLGPYTDPAITTSAYWNNTAPTSTVFTVGNASAANQSGATYVAYLFASCPGVSKVGSYTGNGSTQTINCGFTGGARFVLIKRTDSTGNWWVWDTARGMTAGTDYRLPLNTVDADSNTNNVYTTTGGFQIVTSDATINASGGSYIYLAIA